MKKNYKRAKGGLDPFSEILVASPCDNEAHFLDGGDPLHWGAIGFELIGGRYGELHGVQNLTYSMITTVEESLEMAGVIIFIWALLVFSLTTTKKCDSGLMEFVGKS